MLNQARGGAGGAVGPPPPPSAARGGGRAAGAAGERTGGSAATVGPSETRGDIVSAAEWAAFGPLAPYLALPSATDVLVAPGGTLWLDEGGGLRADATWSLTEPEVRALAVRLIALGGRHVDEAAPIADVRLGRGVRVHVALPPVSVGGTAISIRVPRTAGLSLGRLRAGGIMTPAQEAVLRAAVLGRKNVLVSGGTGAGKTTLLAALLSLARHDERIVVVEDLAELQLAHPHVVSLEARQANLEGAGEIGLARLVREALRMRPDRLVVGECRGAEVRELFAALNTGHDGGAGTMHANSLADVPARIEALGALAGLDAEAIARQAASAIDLVVHLARVDGRRIVSALGTLGVDAAGRLQVGRA